MKIDIEWMKGRNVIVGEVTRSYRTTAAGATGATGSGSTAVTAAPTPVSQNHNSMMPIAAWRSSKSPIYQLQSVGADFFFERDETLNVNSIAIEVPAMTSKQKFDDDRNRLHIAIRPILLVAQCFALLPVVGIQSPDSSGLKFTWKSLKIVYNVIAFIGAFILMIFNIVRIRFNGITAQITTDILFFGANCITMLLFLRLATRWPSFIRTWEKVENEMSAPPLPSTRINLKSRLAIISGFTMSLALVEHLLSIASTYATAKECALLRKDTNIMGTYFQSQFPQVFGLTSYNLWKGVLAQCVNILGAFSWNFMDVFLIILSSALAERFRQINERLHSVKGKAMPDWWWAATREDYNRLANLTRHVDERVSDIVLLSFATNLYFICIQLLRSLKPRRGIPQMTYTIFSFGILLARTVAVSLYAADVNNQSLRPSPILYSVPAASYSTEVQRFLTQTTTDRIGLTGLNFFSITRGLILTVAGTVVTYELILVQFNAMQSVDAAHMNITDACEVN